MDGFNPLDLLASAAELQQKNDDGPERIIVTRQRRSAVSSKSGMANGQKENRELGKNNNNYSTNKGKPNVVIVKKLKKVEVNPELEKMLDEHNYGNAKRTVSHEHSYGSGKRSRNIAGESSVEIHSHTTSIKQSPTETEKFYPPCTDPVVSSHTAKFITGGQSIDKVTTAISNTDCSQLSDSHSINIGKCTVECSDKTTCSHTCVNRICTSSCKHDTTENKFCNIRDDEGTYVFNNVTSPEECLNNQLGHPSTSEQSGDNSGKNLIMKCDNSECIDETETTRDNLEHGTCTPVDDCLKLDEQTGEFITKKDGIISVQSKSTEKDTCESDTLDTSDMINKNIPSSLDSDCVDNETVTKTGSVNSLIAPVVKDSPNYNLKKMPYVKVLTRELDSEPTVNSKPQTVVINIAGGYNSTDKLTKNVGVNKSQLQSYDKVITVSEKVNSDSGIVRSLIVNDFKNNNNSDSTGSKRKSVVLSLNSPKTSKLEMPHCNSHLLGEKSDSCSSFKELGEFTDSVCAEDSTSSVHLLSPDRRNPDSMGIVESPVTHYVNELSISGKFENSYSGQNVDTNVMDTDEHVMPNCLDGCETESPVPLIQLSTTTDNVSSPSLYSNSLLHSDSALDVETPTVETVSDSRELSGSCLLPNEQPSNCDSANSFIPPSTSGTDIPIFRFDSDHCYAGVHRPSTESSAPSEGEEARTPLGSTSELSQDSGYEDVTQSPEALQPPSAAKTVEEVQETMSIVNTPPPVVKTPHVVEAAPVVEATPIVDTKPVVETTSILDTSQNMKNLVPVLVSVNSNGSLTLHDTDLTKTLNRQVFLPENMKLISGSNLSPNSQPPLILSPVTVGKTSQGNQEVQHKPESILELLSPKKSEIKLDTQESPPLTFGTFKIGTFASFSNTGMGLESPKKTVPLVKQINDEKPPKKVSPSNRSRSNSGRSGKSSPVVDTLGTLVQKVKSSLSPAASVDWTGVDHIQHDHDYCTKNLMPSVVSSFLEARLLSKDPPKSKSTHSKGKRSESDSVKLENKPAKRKKIPTSVPKEFMDDIDIDSEGDTHSIPEPVKQKYRVDKFVEPKRTDPKVKITGSSNFQDQFVYFMNTKKRSRRRESKDSPLPTGTDRVFIPPKPGDIIVPHLTDQDIENLKIRSKLTKQPSANAGYNSLRNEFMAAKLSSGTFSTTQPAETVDDEKNIINTILSLENEDLGSPVSSDNPVFNESMEMYGQGLSSDIMNLLPEQMNLTQEQMELLYSAVDEVQNSSPGLIGTDKLVSAEAANSAFQFPVVPFGDSNTPTETPTDVNLPGTSLETPSTAELPTVDNKLEETKSAESNKEVDNNVIADKTEQKDVESKPSKDCIESKEVSGDIVEPASEVTDNIEPANASTSQEEPMIVDSDSVTEAKVPSESPVESTIPTESVDILPTPTEVLPSPTTDILPTVTPTEALPIPTEQIPVSASSGTFSLPTSVTSFDTFTPPVVSASDAVVAIGPGGDAQTEKSLFSTPNLGAGLVTPSSFGSELASVSSTPASEISLPPIDKSLDLLGNIRFDRGDLFSESSVPVNGVPRPPTTVVPPPSQVDYNAPWIVTVSMYWNDLPAIMINNQPYVRLVDIHKQILPAKDTGILKKRCQLMGIAVENCSEMQRYFLVQYGKAINSKSTLIISKESAKVLIGYYVEPQPKAARLDDHHKSIIDHRREQLRRIALARRAAVRAQRLSEKKDDPDPREIKDMVVDDKPELPVQKSHPEPSKRVEVPVVTSGLTVTHNTVADTSRSQRATRHKKINFLEMLRGDTSNQTSEDVTVEHKKTNHKVQNDSAESKKKAAAASRERKMKIVKYTIETDSSETESVESDYSSEYCDTDTSTEEESPVPEPVKPRKVPPQKLVTKIKSKVKPLQKQFSNNKPPMKLKLATKRLKPTATSTPIPVQLVSKGTGTAAQIYRSKLNSKWKNFEMKGSSQLRTAGLSNSKNLSVTTSESGTSTGNSVVIDSEGEIQVDSGLIIKPFRPEIADTHELKVSPTLPEDILQTGESTDSHSSELSNSMDTTNHNGDSHINESATGHKLVESVDKFESPGITSVNSVDHVVSPAVAVSENGFRSNSPILTNNAVSELRRKGLSQVGHDELSVRIVHRDSSPLTEQRARSQLGEVFVNRYHNKKSMCVRCYTCRKMMSVDTFLRHLHDISGGLVTLNTPQTIDPSDWDLTETERKLWESFQRKKELFDNNQLPSPDIVKHNIVYEVEAKSNGLVSDIVSMDEEKKKQTGPRIINTPISPPNKSKVVRKSKISGLSKSHPGTNRVSHHKKTPPVHVETPEGLRTSSRKRKVKHLDGFEDYSFSKFPRLMKNAVVEDEDN